MGGPGSRTHEKGQVVQKDGSVGGESSTRSFKKFGRKKEVGGLRDLGVQGLCSCEDV